MEGIRACLALTLFVLGVYCLIELLISGFDPELLLAAVACLALAYWVLPKRREHAEDAYWWVDLIELLVEFPYRAIALLFRGLGRGLDDD